MAAITSASVSIPSFTGIKSITTAAATTSRITTAKVSSAPMLSIKASSLKDQLSAAAVATATSALLLAAAPALAAEVLLGSDDGGLAFVPNAFSVAAGEKITFKNNAGFPHNVVFDEDEIPSGVDAAKISMSDEDLLNAPGETYSVTLTEKGTYKFYCSPHQGAGMAGQVTVN